MHYVCQELFTAPNEQFSLLNRASSETTSRETRQGASWSSGMTSTGS